MRSATRLAGIALALIAGCGGACGAKNQPAPAPAEAAKTPAASAAETRADQPPDAPHPAWTVAPDSELTRKLRAAQTLIEQDRKLDKLVSEKELRDALGDKLGAFEADGDVTSTVGNDPAAQLVVAARNYKNGASVARLRITDTALLPSARHAVSSHLTLLGNEAAGHEAGAFVRGYPAVLGHYDTGGRSRATALIGGRYLIQITVEASDEPDAAQHVLEALDWSRLAPKQGKP